MSLKFINLPKVLKKLDVDYIWTMNGGYAVYPDSPKFAKKLRQHMLWIGLNEKDELIVSKSLLNCGNEWLDKLAHIKSNNPTKWNEIIAE